MAGPKDQAPEREHGPDSVRARESDPVATDLRQRMERLPPSHPSSPYNDDGSRKPPVPDPFQHDYPIPGDPDYVAADDGPSRELPSGDRGRIRDLDSREQHERRLSQITDQLAERCREAEGRDADGNYGEQGLTPAMRRIESQLDHGHLAEKTEEYALKDAGRLKEKLAERIGRFPNADLSDLMAEIHDGIRYTFIFDIEHYTASVDLAESKLAEAGYDHIETKPGWHGDEYKGVNSQWGDPDSGLRFEVQFHTDESWSARQTTHWAYEDIRSTSVSVEETESLRAYQREVSATVRIPPGALDIPAYKKEG